MTPPTPRFTRFANATPEEYGRFRCPKCGVVGIVDEDQARGRVSIVCGQRGCDFHETLTLVTAGATPPTE